ncbi:MAG: MotA/TolQ/ExbB proton channel family protein, partial [Nitrospirota bacterium]
MKDSAFHLILQAGYLVKGVLVILLFFSIISWAIIFFKQKYFSKANNENENFMKAYRSARRPKELYEAARNLTISPIANVYRAVYEDEAHKPKGETRRLLRRYGALESAKLERYLNFLATTGSTTPFIGLFGTVWGIMNAFRGIGSAG